MMAPRTFSTDDVARQDALSYWSDLICGVFINLDCQAEQSGNFSGVIETQKLADFELSTMTASGMRLDRTGRHIARAKDDHFLIVLQNAGRMQSEQDSRTSALGGGDLALFDSARPYSATLASTFSHTVLKVPRSMMRDRYGPIEAYCGQRIPGDRGTGRLASNYLRLLPHALNGMEPEAASRLASIALDLFAASISYAAGAKLTSDGANRVAHRVRIKTFIEANLHEPDLGLSSIGAALRLSPRYLSELFSGEGISLTRHIWDRRLERCRAALQDPAQGCRSISSIAFGLGFNNMSHLSRVFKERYRMTPSEFRASVVRAPRQG